MYIFPVCIFSLLRANRKHRVQYACGNSKTLEEYRTFNSCVIMPNSNQLAGRVNSSFLLQVIAVSEFITGLYSHGVGGGGGAMV